MTDMEGFRGIHLETMHAPTEYPPAQLEFAVAIARAMERGKFVLVEEPAEPWEWDS
jgi:hypothetical protein